MPPPFARAAEAAGGVEAVAVGTNAPHCTLVDICGGGGGVWSVHTRVQRTSVSVSRTSTSTHTHALMNTHMCKACPPHTNACTHVCCRASERRAREHNIRVQRVWRARSHPLVQMWRVRTHVCNATHRARAAVCNSTPHTHTRVCNATPHPLLCNAIPGVHTRVQPRSHAAHTPPSPPHTFAPPVAHPSPPPLPPVVAPLPPPAPPCTPLAHALHAPWQWLLLRRL